MSSMCMMIFLLFFLLLKFTASHEDNFTYNGFRGANLSLDGAASISSSGLLELTDGRKQEKGHAFYPTPLPFRTADGTILSFSTTFVLSILCDAEDLSGDGMAFVVSRTNNLSSAFPSQYLGLLNNSVGNQTNHIFAVEFDTVQNPELQDINDNHVGIDINSLISNISQTAGYYDDSTGSFRNLSLTSGQRIQVWVDFYSELSRVDVTLSPFPMPKPFKPLLNATIDLESLIMDTMYVGFSSSTGPFRDRHIILGWSFMMNGVANPLDYTKLPCLSNINQIKGSRNVIAISLTVALCSLALLAVSATVLLIVRRRRSKRYSELLEDWELEYGPHRFAYKDLFRATKGFNEKELMGTGGFGRVYRGVLPTSRMEIAVKKVSHESRQGMKEFVAEIVTIGRLRHRNLVQLLGYCRRKGELHLVYDFMPNGSLDKFLYDRTKPTLNWAQRFQIIKGVAAGLLYLHEEWEQLVVHRDVKASNVLLDSEMNGRLGDFGLAKLCGRGTDPQTTYVAGTMGYIAPELARTGKATTATDVFAFGAFLLEVACGRRPIDPYAQEEELVLVDLVLANWQRGSVLETRDRRLGEVYCAYEVVLVLKLGLFCSHPIPGARPSMRQVMQILDGDLALPEFSPSHLSYSLLLSGNKEVFDGINSLPTPVDSLSGLSGGR